MTSQAETSSRLPVEEQIKQELGVFTELLSNREQSGLPTIIIVSVTGGEGSGKTTTLRILRELLGTHGVATKTAKMLGGTDVSNDIRASLLGGSLESTSTPTVTTLMQAAISECAEQVRQHVLTHTDEHGTDAPLIICTERSVLDTGVYQIMAAGNQSINPVEVTARNLTFFKDVGLLPTVTVIVNVHPKTGLARKSDQGEITAIEAREFDFHQAVYESFGFLEELAKHRPEIASIDAEQTPEEIVLDVIELLTHILQVNQNQPIIGRPSDFEDALSWISPDRSDTRFNMALKILEKSRGEKSPAVKQQYDLVAVLNQVFEIITDPEQQRLICQALSLNRGVSTVFRYAIGHPEENLVPTYFAYLSHLSSNSKAFQTRFAELVYMLDGVEHNIEQIMRRNLSLLMGEYST